MNLSKTFRNEGLFFALLPGYKKRLRFRFRFRLRWRKPPAIIYHLSTISHGHEPNHEPKGQTPEDFRSKD